MKARQTVKKFFTETVIPIVAGAIIGICIAHLFDEPIQPTLYSEISMEQIDKAWGAGYAWGYEDGYNKAKGAK